MKKLYVGILFGVFALASFMAMNLYTSVAFPGFGSSETCNNCHNQPALVKTVNDMSFSLSDFSAANALFDNNALWARNEVPVIPTNNRSDANLEFVAMTFLKNSTHLMVLAQIPDSTPMTAGVTTPSTTSDKFGLIFNIDVANFTVGDFLSYYNSSSSAPLDQVLSGQMSFREGHADFWYLDIGKSGSNTTGMMVDESIGSAPTGSNSISVDTKQDVSYGVYYGSTGHGTGYRIFMVRPLNTADSNDAQFNVDGTAIHYAIASWDNSKAEYHHSSFDQMIIVGNEFNVVKSSVQTTTVTETKTEAGSTTTSGTTSSFTAVFVLAGLAVSIPLISHMRKRKE